MWRTVIVTKGEKLTVRDNWLVVYSDGSEQRVPIGDIYSVVIDNRAALISVNAITTLVKANVHIHFCDETHVPVALALPLNTHYKPLGVIKKQMALSPEFKNAIWQRLVIQKITNQIICLKLAGVKKSDIEPLEEMVENVLPGDSTNRIEKLRLISEKCLLKMVSLCFSTLFI